MPFRSPTPDRLLRRFQRTGDPAALGELFDRTAPELLRVAAWLCGNRADAEDLLQRTFVTVIEARERFDARRRALPWLCGILGNLAKKLRDERARAAPLGRAAAGERDPAAAAADAEFAASIAAVRRELGSPYREVLDLHLGEGMNAKEIALRLGRPAGTVRTQLVRALELLRQRLPHGFVAGVVAAATCDAAQLAAVKAAVLIAAREAAILAPAAAAGAASGIAGALATAAANTGTMVMGKKAIAFVPVLALLLGFAVWASWPPAAAVEPRAEAPTPAVASLADRPDEPATAAGADPTPPAERVALAAPELDDDPGFATVRVTVRWKDDGSLASQVGVYATPIADLPLHARQEVTAIDGVARLRHLRPGRWRIRCSHGMNESRSRAIVELRDGQREELELLAARTTTVRGRVLDPDGVPVAEATIWSSHASAPAEPFPATRSDANGWFALPWDDLHRLHARKDGFAPSYVRDRRIAPGEVVELRLRDGGGSLHGRVVDGRGEPVKWAKVLVGPRHENTTVCYPNVSRCSARGELIETGADGRFAANGITEHVEVRAWAAGHGLFFERLHVPRGERRELTIRLCGGASVHGVVSLGETPVQGAIVAFGGVDHRAFRGTGGISDDAGASVEDRPPAGDLDLHAFGATSATTDDAGRFVLDGLPAGDVELMASKDGFRAKTTLSLRAGESSSWHPMLGLGETVTGIVVDEQDLPLRGVWVGIRNDGEAWPKHGTSTGADGRFTLSHVGTAPVELQVLRQDHLLRQLHGIAPGTSELVVRVRASDLPTARLRGRVLDERGTPLRAFVHALRQRARRTNGAMADAETGRFEVGPVAADGYEVSVWNQDRGTVSLGRIALGAHETADLGDIVLRPPGRAEITLRDTCGEPIPSLQAVVCSLEGQTTASVEFQRGRGLVERLQPGRHFLHIHWHRQVTSAAFDVRSGETTTVALRTQPAAAVVLRCRDPEGVQRLTVTMRAFAEDRLVAAILRTSADDKEPLLLETSFAPGRYELECTTSDGRTTKAALHVLAAEQPVDLTIDLPRR